jgi:hypothetical protein
VIETTLGATSAFLRDQWTGANTFSAELGVVPDADVWNAASRAVKGLRQQLQAAGVAKASK